MKKITFLYILVFGIISCNLDDNKRIDNSDLIGKWNWVSTKGGINGNINETPASTGKIIHLSLKNDYTFSIIENGNEISNGTYEITMKRSIYSGEIERYIKLETIDQQNIGFVKNGIVSAFQSQTLQISDNFYDGIGSTFEKME